MSWNQDFDLRSGLALAAENLPVTASPEAQKACLEFIIGRLRAQMIDQGARYDVVDAVLAAQGANPAGAARAVKILGVQINAPDWNSILPAYARCVRITRDQKETFVVLPDLLVDPSEKELYQAVEKAEKTPHKAGSMEDFFTIFQPLIPTINRFFEAVLVMAEDAQVRANRLGLLQRLAHLADGVVDFSLLEGF
jgi:glycyl-tRNA synthetase